MPPILTIENLSLSLPEPGDDRMQPILNGISLHINAGETHALVGESGSGKTVTALTILRLLEDMSRPKVSGRVVFDDTDLLSLPRDAVRRRRGNDIAMIFQEPMTALNPVYPIGRQLMEPLMLHQHLDRAAARRLAIQLLDRTGIEEPEQRISSFPHQLSGGQRQRVIIAMALACRPQLLIADEPTTALDVTIQNQILDLIVDIQREFGMAVLLITHDLHLVRRMADTLSIIQHGHIVEQGTVHRIFNQPEEDYTIHLLGSLPTTVQATRPGTESLISMTDVRCSFTLTDQDGSWLRRKKKILHAVDGIDLTLRRGTTMGVVGESGSGKSTLALSLLRLVRSTGSIRFHRPEGNVELDALGARSMRPLRRELQIVFQDPYSSLSPRMTVEQIISEGLQVHRLCPDIEERRRLVAQALVEVELDPEMAGRFPHEFSGGQRQRIAIARVMVLKPRLVILDEPTSALDVTIQAQIIELLRQLQQRHRITYMFITHDLRVVRSLADDLVVMQHGRIVEQGPAAAIFAAPAHAYTKRLFEAAFN